MLPLKNFQGGALWVQDDDVCESEKVTKTLSNGKEISGRLLELEVGRRIEFTPRVWHEVQPWVGDRLVMLLFTPRTSKLSKESVDELNNAGFNVHVPPEGQDEQVSEEEEENEPIVKAIHIDSGIDLGFVEVNDEEFFPSHGTGEAQTSGLLVNKDNEVNIRKLLKKAEVHYTPDIENILENLVKSGKTLEVTHNVCLADVRKNLVKWRPSAKKEFENLKDAKQAFVVKKRCDLPANCKIVPSKGVYTVKPDKSPEGFRRKTRFVACGNHVSEDSSSIDLYAAGIDAVSLRAIMTMNAGRKWRTATTDVRQAFALAEWLGDPVALEPPAIAYELGLAERGDMWQVKQAIYGLRESPALWSKFRDNELRKARWMINLNDEPLLMKMEQLITDDQIWSIAREDGKDTETYGYVLVYIDDLLIQSDDQNLQGFFQWLSAKWEVDALDILQEGHPIRFLGMELHQVQGAVELCQEGFIRELLRSYKHDGSRSTSQGQRELLILSHEEEQALLESEPANLEGLEAEVKQAQKRVGELMWLMSRTRPDIQYVTSLMASRITRSPELVNRIGQRLLDYLNETIGYRIRLEDQSEGDIKLSVYTDSSFAPSAGRSHGFTAVFIGQTPIAWRSSRQPLVTLSTAESELIEGIEGTLMGLSVREVIQEILKRLILVDLYVDNQAAVTLLTASSGSWRTRHLKLRSHWMKERIRSEEVRVQHVAGAFQRADLGTKTFYKDSFEGVGRPVEHCGPEDLDLYNIFEGCKDR